MKQKKQKDRNQEMLKNIDKELDELYSRMTAYDPGDKVEFVKYGMYTRRMQELVKIRGDLIQQDKTDKEWRTDQKLKAAAIGIDIAKIATAIGTVGVLRDSEIDNERIFGRSMAWKYVPKIKM